jgi:hypothetical protein
MHDYLKQMVGQDVTIPPIPEKKKMFGLVSAGKKEEAEEEEQSEDGSDHNDSEDETEDFQERKLMQFFSKINENR